METSLQISRRRFSRRTALAMLIAVFVTGWMLTGSRMSGDDPVQQSGALVVLGGGAGGSRERLACNIWGAGLAAGPVILTGGGQDAVIGDRISFLERCGIPARSIHSWDQTANTYEEMRTLRDFLVSEGVGRATVVSDAPHMPRLRFLRQSFGLQGRVALRESRLVIGPDVASIARAVMFWAREPAAYIYYRVKYHD